MEQVDFAALFMGQDPKEDAAKYPLSWGRILPWRKDTRIPSYRREKFFLQIMNIFVINGCL